MTQLQVCDLGFSFGKRNVLQNISFYVAKGEFIGLIGLNGSGKTTLLKLIQRILRPQYGSILVHGCDLQNYSAQEIARKIASVPQKISLSFDFTVKQFVMLGRTPYLNLWKQPNATDENVVLEIMRRTDCLPLAESSVLKLSAGELQRVCIAASLAQQPEILLLDEPTNSLDLRQKARFSALLHQLQNQQVSIICASHDLHFLQLHCDRILLLHNGWQLEFGPMTQVLHSKHFCELLEEEESIVG
jgi:cobalamin transport system ATP-binding protein